MLFRIPWMLMTWWRKEPGHQQVWHWPSFPRIFQKVWHVLIVHLSDPLAKERSKSGHNSYSESGDSGECSEECVVSHITKFAPNMNPKILSAVVENGGHWPWPSRSFWPFSLRILGISACPHHKLLRIWATITKFAWNIHLGILMLRMKNRGHWPWPSRSFGHFSSEFQERHSTLLLYTDLGRPRTVTCPIWEIKRLVMYH